LEELTGVPAKAFAYVTGGEQAMSESIGKRVFSGIQPSGAIHLGNYAGAIKNWARLQDLTECFYCIVDYHAMTIPYRPQELGERIHVAAVDILACGVDPEKCRLFVQSDVPEHTELTWILSCVAPMGELNRMTQFKEKSDRVDSVTVGLFTYPVLQSADILLYKADSVPVGEDQLQHLEVSREIARRFNNSFGPLFPEPKPLLTSAPRVMSLQDPGSKMSKSVQGSAIMLGDEEASIVKAIKRAVTGMGEPGEVPPGVANLLTLLEICDQYETAARFRADQEAGTIRYGDLKAALTEALLATLAPIRERRQALMARPERVREILGDSAATVRAVARQVIAEAREAVGLRPRPLG
jgi:tryptophanyl-tRNA synthetase